MTMCIEQSISDRGNKRLGFDSKLAGYLAATGALGSYLATETEAAIVWNNTIQPFGINEKVDIDFNSDGQTDIRINHNRVNLNGNDIDFLQVDKNDVSSAANPLPVDAPLFLSTFPVGVGAQNNPWLTAYAAEAQGHYPSALTQGSLIGPTTFMDFQENDNFNGSGEYIRVNRLIDEDAGQIDADAGLATYSPLPGTPNFVGLGGEVRYLGVQVSLNGGNPLAPIHQDVNYGWIGIQITNEDDATGNVVGWAYQTEPGVAIRAGQIPEPSSIVTAFLGGAFLLGGLLTRRLFGRRRS